MMNTYVCFAAVLLQCLLVNASGASNKVFVDDDLVNKLLARMEVLETRDKEREAEMESLRGIIRNVTERLGDMDSLRDTIHNTNKRVNELDQSRHTDDVNSLLAHADELDGITRENDKRLPVSGALKSDMSVVKNTADTSNKTGGLSLDNSVTADAILNESHLTNTGDEPDLQNHEPIDPASRVVQKPRQRRQQNNVNAAGVGFYAVVDTHHLRNLGAHQRLEFDRVVTNVGNAYHPNMGVFICPRAGLYVFSASLMGVNHDNTHYYISLNGQAVANLFIHGTDSYLATSSRTVVLDLAAGDEVSVNNVNVTEGVFGFQFSSFSGVLVSNVGVLDPVVVG